MSTKQKKKHKNKTLFPAAYFFIREPNRAFLDPHLVRQSLTDMIWFWFFSFYMPLLHVHFRVSSPQNLYFLFQIYHCAEGKLHLLMDKRPVLLLSGCTFLQCLIWMIRCMFKEYNTVFLYEIFGLSWVARSWFTERDIAVGSFESFFLAFWTPEAKCHVVHLDAQVAGKRNTMCFGMNYPFKYLQ